MPRLVACIIYLGDCAVSPVVYSIEMSAVQNILFVLSLGLGITRLNANVIPPVVCMTATYLLLQTQPQYFLGSNAMEKCQAAVYVFIMSVSVYIANEHNTAAIRATIQAGFKLIQLLLDAANDCVYHLQFCVGQWL